ncbi:hypothetical protein [Chitinophaga pinensis]|uniref:Uncharacterized protein n=1 Tax=Chitinophaga pinensis (strain ATCC 43595 / DSM 2588 / LMG 13176 / NBRC 15968 / NCIMB 11800 / UQM 2034) TaxID=485918 RepID=A0A979G5M7_CHIPD|nr:hypothetical protein [Chitinophaga pinensis]ACU61257.1 conserved hypothetical protein [Chitinophaga pinensis DSM 2588]
MNLIKFDEVLNDLVDYFLLGDPFLLMDFKKELQLPDDLITHFTISTDGDRVVEEGVMIPLARIENYPYTVYFNQTGTPELLKEGNRLQLRQDGYKLLVKYGAIYLFTIPYIRKFTAETLDKLVRHRSSKISLPNGWYEVSVLGGESKQDTGMEPTLEFMIRSVAAEPAYTADTNFEYKIDASEY